MSSQAWKDANQDKIREYRRDWYSRNKKHAQQKVNDRKRRMRRWLQLYKQTLCCYECGEDHPAALDFHHRDPEEKELEVHRLLRTFRSFERILEEIAKCTVLCSNCHRKHHWTERNCEGV